MILRAFLAGAVFLGGLGTAGVLLGTTVVVASSQGSDASASVGRIEGLAVPLELAEVEREGLASCPDLPSSILEALGFVASLSGRLLNTPPPWWSWPSGRFGIEMATTFSARQDVEAAVAVLCTAIRQYPSIPHALQALLGDQQAVRVVEVVSLALAGQPMLSAGRAQAIETAAWALGLPYQWGGNGPRTYDCSGLMVAAWKSAGVALPRTAQQQFDWLTPNVSHPMPGDLLFFGASTAAVSHVGIEIGAGLMIDAPYTGAVVRIDPDGAPTAVGIGQVS
jgi:hypothetical protein